MRIGVLSAIAITLLLPACSTTERTAPLAGKPVPPAPYVRITHTNSNLLRLQIALREFAPPRRNGAVVWLAAVSHLGDTNDFALR